jgi:hypothetical protein
MQEKSEKPNGTHQTIPLELGGCHHCGTRRPGTLSGDFILDYIPPDMLGIPKRIYPHCAYCSRIQGGVLRHIYIFPEKYGRSREDIITHKSPVVSSYSISNSLSSDNTRNCDRGVPREEE